ncbi:MAG TPA: choice-of-anchor tandem repeat NxxGxxAF-containing protein, partial [Terriglobales bacterium]|nr:choice-of-anchor tandem repeat NxxGxxAF-containing protein [Terriglobales bacterium]
MSANGRRFHGFVSFLIFMSVVSTGAPAQSIVPNVQQWLTDANLKSGTVVGGNLGSYPAASLLANPGANVDVNQNGDFLFANTTALFFRKASTGVTTRIVQAGDAYPGFPGSRVNTVNFVHLNASGQAVFNVNVNTTDGLLRTIVTRWDGSTLIPIAANVDSAPGGNGLMYGGVIPVGIDSAGDVAFTATLATTVPLPVDLRTLYIAPAGGTPVRIVGVNDAAPGTTSIFTSLSVAQGMSINASGQVVFSANFGGGNGIWMAKLANGVASVSKIVAQGDAFPTPLNGTFGAVSVSNNGFQSLSIFLNSSGQVAFSASGAVWLYTPATGIAQMVAGGDAAPAFPTAGTIGVPSILGLGDNGSVLFSTFTGSTNEILVAFSPHTFATVYYFGEATPGVTGTTFNSLPIASTIAINASGTVAFRAGYASVLTSGFGVFQSIPVAGGATPPTLSKIAVDGDPSNVTGGGTLLNVSVGFVKLLNSGAALFAPSVAGGTATAVYCFGSPEGLTTYMSTADAVPSGANAITAGSGFRTAGPWTAFVGAMAGGRASIFAFNSTSNTVYRVVTDGDAAPGLPAGTVISGNLAFSEVFVNANGQLAFGSALIGTAFPSGGTAVWRWDPSNGVQKVAATGDLDPSSGQPLIFVGVPISNYVNSPINAAGRVYFRAGISGGSLGGFVWTAGATPGAGTLAKVVLPGDAAPGAGTFGAVNFASPNVNEVFTDNGNVYFYDTVTGGANGIYAYIPSTGMVKVAAVGDSFGGTTTISGFTSALEVNASGQVLFAANLADGRSGLFLGSAGGTVSAIALNGDAAPGGGTLSFLSFSSSAGSSSAMDASINGAGNIAFRAGLANAPTSDSGIFLYNAATKQISSVALSFTDAPGTNSGFNTMPVSTLGRAGEFLTLTDSNEIYFQADVFQATAPVAGWWHYRSDGVVEKLYLRGDPAPNTNGGLYGGGASHVDVVGSGSPFFGTSVTNSSVLSALWQPVLTIGADLATSFGGPAPATVAINVPQSVDVFVYNYGPSQSTGASVTVTLSPGNAGTFSNLPNPDCVNNGSSITCPLGAFPPVAGNSGDNHGTFTVTPTALGPASLTAQVVAGNEPDPVSGNNTAIVSTTVVTGADTFITGSAATDAGTNTATLGSQVTYTFNVGNNGPGQPPSFAVNFIAPAGFTATSITSPAGTCTPAPLSCTMSNPAPSWSSTITIVGTASQVGKSQLSAAISDGGYAEAVPGNETLSILLTTVPAAGADEYYFVAESYKSLLRVFRTSDNVEIKPPLTTGVGPFSIAISPNGRTAYVSSRAGAYISVVDIPTRTEIARWPSLASMDLALSADGTTLVGSTGRSLQIFNTATGQLATPTLGGLTTPATGVVIAGSAAYVNELFNGITTGGVQRVDLSTFAVTTIAGTQVGTLGNSNLNRKTIAATADGRYVVAARANLVVTIDTQNGNAVTNSPAPNDGLGNAQNAVGLAVTRDASDPNGNFAYVMLTESNAAGVAVSALDLRTGSGSFGQFFGGAFVTSIATPSTLAVTGNDNQLVLVGNSTSNTDPNIGIGSVVTLDAAQIRPGGNCCGNAILQEFSIGSGVTGGVDVRGLAVGLALTNVQASAPTVSSVNPPSFLTDTAQTLTVSGTNFVSGAQVRIGHGSLLNTTVLSPTQLQVTVPAMTPAGASNVVVINPNSGTVQQQWQAGVLLNGVSVQQVSTFQPAYALATSQIDQYQGTGTRVLKEYPLARNFYIPSGFVVSGDGVRAYTTAVDGITIMNLNSGVVEAQPNDPNAYFGELAAASQ